MLWSGGSTCALAASLCRCGQLRGKMLTGRLPSCCVGESCSSALYSQPAARPVRVQERVRSRKAVSIQEPQDSLASVIKALVSMPIRFYEAGIVSTHLCKQLHTNR